MGISRGGPKVLVVGSGGREHALIHALSRSARQPQLYSYPGNPGMLSISTLLPAVGPSAEEITRAALGEGIDLVAIGPEAYLAQGLVDLCHDAGMLAFGPTRAAAQIETSKSWAKEVMVRAGAPTAGYELCATVDDVDRCLKRLDGAVAVKADGIAAGKGVLVTDDPGEAAAFAGRWLASGAGARVLVEQALQGTELSFFAFVSGEDVLPLGAARDYKRALDGDHGPNTGGMGAISPVDLPGQLQGEIVSRIVQPVAAEMMHSGTPFSGVLYAGLMLTEDGPYVLEFNARFGDPETQVLLPRLETDLLDVIECVATGNLGQSCVTMSKSHACGVAIASAGYPTSSAPRQPVTLGEAPPGSILYHAGTISGAGGQLEASGGRVFTAVGLGVTASEAREKAYTLAQTVRFEGAWHREDIGL